MCGINAFSIILSPVYAYELQNEENRSNVEAARRDIYSLKSTFDELAGDEDDEDEIVYDNAVIDSYWWPIGSKDAKKSDGKLFAMDDPETVTITSKFGETGDVSSHANGHGGLDIGGGRKGETNIIAAKDGTVVYPTDKDKTDCSDGGLGNSCGGGYGNYVIIQHPDGNYTLYGHMFANSITVKAGDNVSRGQVIGKMGTSGDSSGPHLHFEVRLGENTGSARVDPLDYVDPDNPRPSIVSNVVSGTAIELASDTIKKYEGIGCEGKLSEEGDYFIACDGGDGATTIGPGITLEYNHDKLAKYGYGNATVGSRIPKDIIYKVFDEVLNDEYNFIIKKLSENGIDNLKDYQVSVLMSRYYNSQVTLYGGDYSFIDFYKKYNGKYSYDEINSNSGGLWYNSFCHPYAPGSQFELGLQRRRLSEWKMFTTGENDSFGNFYGQPYYCSD